MRRGWVVALTSVTLVVVGCDSSPDRRGDAGRDPIDECEWPMWGHDLDASYTQPCPSGLAPDSVGELTQAWFYDTADAVTATPTVVDGSVYVGDWSGRFYAIDTDSGEARWTFDAPVHPRVYAGQIVGSAAVADVDDVRTVFFGAGKTMYALDADDGSELWRHELGADDDSDPTEIESSPIVVDDLVIFGWDVHNAPDRPAGLRALEASTGDEVWTFQTAPSSDGGGTTGSGCADVWGSASVDTQRRLVFFGTGNCATDEWGPLTEAVVAVDLDSGELEWSYQPHEPNHDDLDFAGRPNLFEGDGHAIVGLGNKDGVYYALDRDTGDELWRATATGAGITNPGSNFSTGGFIGSTAVADGLVVGGTAVGPPPHLHAIHTATGDLAWQNPSPAATYASAAITNGVVFLGGNDFTFRAYDLVDGTILWEHTMGAAIAGGAAIVGDDVYAVSGLREPGLDPSDAGTGVARFSLEATSTTPTTTTGPQSSEEPADVATPGSQPCLGEPCLVPFSLTEPPAGTDPELELIIDLEPWNVTARARGMGPPSAWVREGSPDAAVGATAYALFASESDSNPVGGLLCVLDEDLECDTSRIPRPGATYNRITLLALDDPDEVPEIASGVNRLVTTISFDPPLRPRP